MRVLEEVEGSTCISKIFWSFFSTSTFWTQIYKLRIYIQVFRHVKLQKLRDIYI